jgi:hypothetical protein
MGKSGAGNKGKRSKSNKPARVKYRAKGMIVTNKINKLEKQIKHLNKLKDKHPESKVDISIESLKDRIKEIQYSSKGQK